MALQIYDAICVGMKNGGRCAPFAKTFHSWRPGKEEEQQADCRVCSWRPPLKSILDLMNSDSLGRVDWRMDKVLRCSGGSSSRLRLHVSSSDGVGRRFHNNGLGFRKWCYRVSNNVSLDGKFSSIFLLFLDIFQSGACQWHWKTLKNHQKWPKIGGKIKKPLV